MKAAELRGKSKKDLEELVDEKRARVEELRWLSHQKKVKNVKELAGIKKDIARIITVLRAL